ncbi:biopolymer transporter ExbB [Bacteroidia bacterium]|nr:biopolymer transporter ExbB [Bacteroidia bacterium]
MLLQIETQEVVQQVANAATQTLNTLQTMDVVQTTEEIPVFDLALKGGWLMIPLVILLIVAIYVFIERFIVINKAAKEQPNFMNTIKDFVHDGRLDSAASLCSHTDAPIARMLGKGIARIGKPLNDINTAIENVGKAEVSKLEQRLSWLSISAGAAPMIGFLGTVTGMVRVFFDMASKGNNIEVATLANGMYEAMVTTVGGLIVGIIAYICYNYLVARIEKVVYVLETKATEFMDLLNEPVKK